MARLSGCFPKLHTKLSGWRRLAILNIGGMVLLTLLLCGLTVASILKTDLSQISNDGIHNDNISRADAMRNIFQFYDSSCSERTAQNINTVLHLIVNAVSSTVLASSHRYSARHHAQKWMCRMRREGLSTLGSYHGGMCCVCLPLKRWPGSHC
jgi:hypothetical protein